MKAILMSIHPQWCEKIFNGSKTIEVRKSRPSIPTPFKVYVYQTKHKGGKAIMSEVLNSVYGGGKVIGSFVCDRIVDIQSNGDDCGNYWHEWDDECGIEAMCLSYEELETYLGKSVGYGWHITEPKLFEKPRELGEFCVPCKKYNDSELHCMEWDCEHYSFFSCANGDTEEECLCNGNKPLRRPPQSWVYCETIDEK